MVHRRALRSTSAHLLLGLVACAAAPVQAQDADLSGRYRVDGVAANGRRTSGEVLLARDGAAYLVSRAVDTSPGGQRFSLRGRADLGADGALTVDLDGATGIAGALGGGAAPRAIARYRCDGRGGLVGRHDGPEGGFEETLTPRLDPAEGEAAVVEARRLVAPFAGLPGRDARDPAIALLERVVRSGNSRQASAVVVALDERRLLGTAMSGLTPDALDALPSLYLKDRARAALAREALAYDPRARQAQLITALAFAARRDSLASLRLLIDGLVQRDQLYRVLGLALPADRRKLAALAREVAQPDPAGRENAAAERAFAAMGAAVRNAYEYPLIVVPGYTPTDAARVHALHPTAAARCKRAAEDFRARRAPFILTSGGAVHPESTPVFEALELKAELVRLGVPAERIFVETRARHSTTNLRNAGRFMLARGVREALVVTSFDQSFYFSNPELSTYNARSRRELGYVVGELEHVDAHRTAFRPSRRCLERTEDDPFDP